MIVILSSLNGKDRLSEMLAALKHVDIPAGTTIHAVDNGSDDGTLELLNAFRDRLPLIVYSQPIRGKNHCLNLVLDDLRDSLKPEDIVVFTDDDILPEPDWLEALQKAADSHPAVDVFAGRILPHWPEHMPPQLESIRQHFGILFSLTSSEEGPVKCTMAWGPNMAVRARVFQSGYRFDGRFGPNGTNRYPMGSETELMERLDRAGHSAWFVSRSGVRHMIRPVQLELESILQRAYRHGFGNGWRMQQGRGLPQLARCQLGALRGVIAARVRKLLSPKSKHLLHDFHETWARGYATGALLEFRGAHTSKSPSDTQIAENAEVSAGLSR